MKQKIDRSHQLNAKQDNKIALKQLNQSMEQDMREQVQEILKEKKREKLMKKFYEQKESYDYYLESKDQHQTRIAENKAKQHEEFVRNQDRLMQKVSDESAHIESWKA